LTGLHDYLAFDPGTYENLRPDCPVTLVGTGLTAVDVILRLRELGHRGIVTAVSRHGLLPCVHKQYVPMNEPAIPQDTPPKCVEYLRAFRQALDCGKDWRAAVDSLRATTNDLWLAMPVEEQKRFVRHLQRRWDVVRHRMAPNIGAFLEGELNAGTLQVRKGHVVGIDIGGPGAALVIHGLRGIERLATCRVINCMGPNTNYRQSKTPLLRNLLEHGLATAGPLGRCLFSSPAGAIIDVHGQESATIFAVGPPRLGTLLESIAIPEIRRQAQDLAAELVERVQQQRQCKALSWI
jgi:hydroxyacylglutathione hydrolase